MHGRERPLFCLLILTKEPSPDSGQILLTRRYAWELDFARSFVLGAV
jgi:hypothetical protein